MSTIKEQLDAMLKMSTAPQSAPEATVAPAAPAPAAPAPGLKAISSRAEFEQAIANAKGPVAVLFTQSDCGFCEDDQKGLSELAAKCGGSFTALEVNVSQSDELDKLGDEWDVSGTPTLLYADKAAKMNPDDATEYEVKQLRRKLKCARVKK